MRPAFKIIFLSVFIFINKFYAGTPDSLKAAYIIQKEDIKKVYTSARLLSYYEHQQDSFQRYAQQFLADYKKTKNRFGEAYVYYRIGITGIENSNYDEAKKNLNQAITIFNSAQNDSMSAKAHMRLGFAYYTVADYESAIKTYLSGIEHAQKANRPGTISWGYNLMGLAFYAKPNHDYKKALYYYFKSLDIDRKRKLEAYSGMVIVRIGTVYTKMGDYPNATYYLNRSLKLGDSLKDLNVMNYSLEALVGLYNQKKEYARAIDAGKKALTISLVGHDYPGVVISYRNIGEDNLLLKNYKTAEVYIDSSIYYSLKFSIFQTLPQIYEIKSNICEQMGQSAMALAYYKKSMGLKDSLFSVQNSKNINELETKYETKQKEKEIQFLNVEKESDKKIQSALTIAFSLALLLIGMVVFFLVKINSSRKQLKTQQLETERQKDLVVEKQKEIVASISYAKRLQEAILPPIELIHKYFPESFVLYKPKDIVAGDFYWMEKVDDQLFLAAADSTGHGVPGAIVSVVCSNALNRTIKEFKITDTGKMLDKTRELILDTFSKSASEVKDGMDISLLSINLKTFSVTWSGANNPLWYFSDAAFFEVPADKQPVGLSFTPKPFTTRHLQLKKNDSIYLFTDGYADQFGGPKGKKYKYKQLKDRLAELQKKTMSDQKQILETEFITWKKNLEQVDDVCVIGIKI